MHALPLVFLPAGTSGGASLETCDDTKTAKVPNVAFCPEHSGPCANEIWGSGTCCCDEHFSWVLTNVSGVTLPECVPCKEPENDGLHAGARWIHGFWDEGRKINGFHAAARWLRTYLYWILYTVALPYFWRLGNDVGPGACADACGFSFDEYLAALRGRRLDRQESQAVPLNRVVRETSIDAAGGGLFDYREGPSYDWKLRACTVVRQFKCGFAVEWEYGDDWLPLVKKTNLRPSIPDAAHMSWNQMCESLGLDRGLARAVAVSHLLGWHWLQCALYILIWVAFWDLTNAQQRYLGFIIVLREVAYFGLTILGLCWKPAYLLYSISMAWARPETRQDAIMFVVSPEKWLLRILFSSSSISWSYISLLTSALTLASDAAALVAFCVGYVYNELWGPTVLCYVLDIGGGCVFVYFNFFKVRSAAVEKVITRGRDRFTWLQLQEDGVLEWLVAQKVTLSQLVHTGFSAQRLYDVQFSLDVLRTHFPLQDLVKIKTRDTTWFGTSGSTLEQLIELGFSAKHLKDAGCTRKELELAGFSQGDLEQAGFTYTSALANVVQSIGTISDYLPSLPTLGR